MKSKEKTFMTVKEVAEELQSSDAFAYKIIRKMNDELNQKGYLTIAGKVPRKYFFEKCYGIENDK